MIRTVSPGITPNESLIQELGQEHGIQAVSLPCPCIKDKNKASFLPVDSPKPFCELCDGTGRIQYALSECEFF